MTLPFRRRGRPRGQARLAPVPGRDTQLPASPAEPAWTFEGRSDLGVMPPGVVAIKDWGRDTQPLAFRIRPESGPAS